MSKEKPTLIIPDVHLKRDRLGLILDAWSDRGGVVFLGDFFDDFGDAPSDNAEMAVFLKERVFPLKDCTVLMGNHDLHYHPRCPEALGCSGFSRDKARAIRGVFGDDDWNRFAWAAHAGGFLLTHAGLHPRLVPPFFSGGIDEMCGWVNLQCDKALDTLDEGEPLLRAGYARYGNQPVGGIVWMDVREYEPLEGIPQIFGHTPLSAPSVLAGGTSPSYCLDTHLRHVGVVREGAVEIIETGTGFDEAVDRACSAEKTRRRSIPRSASNSKAGGAERGRGVRGVQG